MSSLLLRNLLCNWTPHRQDVRQNLVHNLLRRTIVHNTKSINRRLQRGQLAIQKLRIHILMLPHCQTSRNQLFRPIKKYKHDMRQRHSVLKHS